jgi:hypothetical protein
MSTTTTDYAALWELIKTADFGKSVTVTVEREHREQLIHAISKIKAADNRARALMHMPTFGVMKVERLPPEKGSSLRTVVFSLPRNMEHFI